MFLYKDLFSVELKKDISPFSLKIIMRDIGRKKLKDIYFKEFDNKFDIKNIGCLVFGQPSVWKGLLTINPVYVNKIKILLDTKRLSFIENVKEEELISFIKDILSELDKEGYLEFKEIK
jgi:hypothetical protein